MLDVSSAFQCSIKCDLRVAVTGMQLIAYVHVIEYDI